LRRASLGARQDANIIHERLVDAISFPVAASVNGERGTGKPCAA